VDVQKAGFSKSALDNRGAPLQNVAVANKGKREGRS
jgi:hypothetical protein